MEDGMGVSSDDDGAYWCEPCKGLVTDPGDEEKEPTCRHLVYIFDTGGGFYIWFHPLIAKVVEAQMDEEPEEESVRKAIGCDFCGERGLCGSRTAGDGQRSKEEMKREGWITVGRNGYS
jgi:hypothetical protein